MEQEPRPGVRTRIVRRCVALPDRPSKGFTMNVRPLFRKNRLLLIPLFSLLAVLPAYADPHEIIATPVETSGSFIHNVFHTAGAHGGAGGFIKAWFDLDTTQTSTWDPTTGALNLYVNVFANSSFTTQIGSAVGVTSVDPLRASDFNNFDNSVIGVIDWSITLPTGSAFRHYLKNHVGHEADHVWDLSLSYIDHDYVTSGQGFRANSWEDDHVTLWGADGEHTGGGQFNTSTTHLGTDIVFQVGPSPVPAPGAALLASLGFAAVGVVRRRFA